MTICSPFTSMYRCRLHGDIPSEPGLASSPSVSSSKFWNKTFDNERQRFFYWLDVLAVTQTAMSNHWRKRKYKALTLVSGLALSFLPPPWDCSTIGIPPFMPALKWQYHSLTCVIKLCNLIIIIITDMIFMVLSSCKAIVRVHPVHMMNADSAPRWPPTFRPCQPTWTASPPERNGSYRPHPPSPFIITQPESSYSLYRPTEGGRLSRPGHCSKDVQPFPKAVYCSGCHDKHKTARGEIWTWVLSHRSQACYR